MSTERPKLHLPLPPGRDRRRAGPSGGGLQFQDLVLLQHDDGTMFSMSLLGGFMGDKHYPRLTSSPVRIWLNPVDTTRSGTIQSGDRVYLCSDEQPLASSNYLGAWSTKDLYYWSSGHDQQIWTIYKAGGGDINYGDAVWFINEHYKEQRLGRDSDKLYLTTNEHFTDTFTVLEFFDLPLISNFLPLDQSCINGVQDENTYRGYQWYKPSPNAYIYNVTSSVPAGSYTVLIQLAHDSKLGTELGTMYVSVDNNIAVQQKVYAHSFEPDDWQRATATVTLPDPGLLTVSFIAANNSDHLETGCCSIAPAGQRPLYVIAHHKNTIDEMLQAAKDGANAIEFDISAKLEDGEIVYYVHHGAPDHDPWLPLHDYLQAIIDNYVLVTVSMLMFDIKPNPDLDTYDYGYDLAMLVQEYGITAQQAFLSVEAPEECAAFYQGVADARFAGARDCSLIGGSSLVPVTVDTDPSIWYRTGVEANGATFLGLGVSAGDILSPMRSWLEVVSYTVNMRDRVQQLKKTYFWTLNSPASMRKVLDLGVDGIIVNDPKSLLSVLQEQPYASMFRLATSDDPLEVWGWPPA